MTKAKLFRLKEADWRKITNDPRSKNIPAFNNQIAIFQEKKDFPMFAIICTSLEIGEIIEKHGGLLIPSDDLSYSIFKEDSYLLLFGQKGLSEFLSE